MYVHCLRTFRLDLIFIFTPGLDNYFRKIYSWARFIRFNFVGSRSNCLNFGIFYFSIKHVTDSNRNGFDSEYAIPIEFILHSADSDQFCFSFFRFRTIFFISKNYKFAAFQIMYCSVAHEKRKEKKNIVSE